MNLIVKTFFLIVLLIIIRSNFSYCQEKMSTEEKLKMIDKEIEEAQDAKNLGIYLVIGGVVAQGIGWATYDPVSTYSWSSYGGSSVDEPDNTLAWILVGAGSVATIWGAYKWIDNANQVTTLKAKRYDISFNPILKVDKFGHLTPGINLHISL